VWLWVGGFGRGECGVRFVGVELWMSGGWVTRLGWDVGAWVRLGYDLEWG